MIGPSAIASMTGDSSIAAHGQRELVALRRGDREARRRRRASAPSPSPRRRSRRRRPRPVSTASAPSAQSNVNRPPTVFGSTELTISLSPKASAPSWRIAGHALHAGGRRRAPSRPPGRSATSRRRPSPRAWRSTRRSSEPVVESRRPWATTVTRVTSATPIIIAEAVTAVRPGLRIALRRASRPAEPPTRSADAADHARRAAARRGRAGGPSPSPARRRAGRRPAARGSRATPARGRRASVTSDADRAATTITVRAANTMPASGRSMSIEAEHGVQALGDAEAGAEADQRGEHADRQRLDQHGRRAPAGAPRRPSAAARTRASAGRP